jgi:hypothetical protein
VNTSFILMAIPVLALSALVPAAILILGFLLLGDRDRR